VTTHPQPGFIDALDALQRALDDHGTPSMIIGGVAVIAHGIPRLTVDVDATVVAAGLDLDDLIDTLSRHDIRARIPDAVAFARERQVFLGVHEPSGTPVDVSLAWLPFEEDALRARQACDYAGVAIRIPRPEDLLIYKVIASRPQDIDDAEGLLVLHGATMNVGRVREVVGQLAAALDDVERPRTLERLLVKTGGAR
jgi:hypothetical protein